MKKLVFKLLCLTTASVFSQVGINTESPKATLDVNGQTIIRDIPNSKSTFKNLGVNENGLIVQNSLPESLNLIKNLYIGHALIPSTNTYCQPDLETNDWKVINKSTISSKVVIQKTNTGKQFVSIKPSKMIITYEYKGKQNFNPNSIILFTPGNNLDYPDTFVINFQNLKTVNGKSQLTINIVRVDTMLSEVGTSDWGSNKFSLNILIIELNSTPQN